LRLHSGNKEGIGLLLGVNEAGSFNAPRGRKPKKALEKKIQLTRGTDKKAPYPAHQTKWREDPPSLEKKLRLEGEQERPAGTFLSRRRSSTERTLRPA